MASIYEQALGAEFRKLHPRIQERFGFGSRDRVASIGHGTMEQVWYAKWAVAPLLLGATRHIMFPQGGRDIPFNIRNYAYVDSFGRETVTWLRAFRFPGAIRKFDATMIYSEKRSRIVDYLGSKQHLAVDLELSAEPNGGLRIRSSDQRFYERWLRFPFPRTLTGTADVCEWYDDEAGCFQIRVQVVNPMAGPVFRYSGTFQAAFVSVAPHDIPLDAKPLREEARE
ncbi:DUF4166 domain-containing protein [Paenibacillus xanthanilyticus]|uniref:DUF4166 domain-containing protein n=1 Tax=Paenibacillus xanthanilyticus TaxID=1783531 RepID=A0ABV8K573_9BACL